MTVPIDVEQRYFAKEMLREFALFLIAIVCLVLTVGGFHYYFKSNSLQAINSTVESSSVELAKKSIENSLDSVSADLLFLAQNSHNLGLFDSSLPGLRQQLKLLFLTLIRQHSEYSQIRFLDESGIEVVRVDFNDGRSYAVPDSLLQDKHARYYFGKTWALNKNEIYISPIDLNIERGEIEVPPNPVMRFGTTVFNSQGRKVGIVLINYLGNRLLDNFQQATMDSAGHLELVNQQGYWLSHPEPSREWGFMYGREDTFGKQRPETWKTINSERTGQFATEQEYITFTTVDLQTLSSANNKSLLSGPSYQWKIVSFLSSAKLNALRDFRVFLPLYALAALLLGLASFAFAQMRERHRKVQSIAEYMSRFHRALESIDLLVVEVDLDGQIRFCNEAVLVLSGWQRADLIDKNWIDLFVASENKKRYQKQFLHIAESNRKTRQRSSRMLTRDNEAVEVRWNITPMPSAGEELVGFTCVGENVTERVRLEARFRQIFEATPNAMIMVNHLGSIVLVNSEAENCFGYERKNLVGQSVEVLLPDTGRSHHPELVKSYFRSPETRRLGEGRNLLGKHHDGTILNLEIGLAPVESEDGLFVLCAFIDTSEQKRLEAELKQSNLDIAKAESLATVGRMANMVAHDLRNPLSSVKMSLQILGKKPTTDWGVEERELRTIALEQVRYMERIMQDLLSYSRDMKLNAEWIQLEKLLDTVILLAQGQSNEKHIHIHTQHQPGLPTVHADSDRLRQVFSNLILNAIDATEDNSTESDIMVSTHLILDENHQSIRVEITDHGPGISADIAGKIFEPFFTTRSKGTGLGLAIVRKIVEAHGGNVCFENIGGSGARVVVVLPTILPEDNRAVSGTGSTDESSDEVAMGREKTPAGNMP